MTCSILLSLRYFKQLYYQWKLQTQGHKVTTEMKEAFYLNEEIKVIPISWKELI